MRVGAPFDEWDVQTSFLQRAASGPTAHVRVLPLMPLAFRAMRLPEAEFVVTSFHTFALHARVPPNTPHLVYCHTPPRFLWSTEQLRAQRPLTRAASAVAAPVLRPIDRGRTRRPLQFVSNSRATAERVASTYGLPSEVVHPPVDVARFSAHRHTPQGDHFLVVSRLVPYKRIDLAVDAFTELGWPLVVAGTGRAARALEARAGPNVRFLGRVPDEDMGPLMASARALVFPGEEDFGIVPIEAMAAGTPIVAFRAGGLVETVEEGRSGTFFDNQDRASLIAAVRHAASIEWDSDDVSASVEHFDERRFAAAVTDIASAIR
jgi:glycosyltransferase involved in cell wall biosynthesis